MIAVVDYGMGNLHSVSKAFEAAGAQVRVTTKAQDLRDAERIVLPGQGAFRDCMDALRDSGVVDALREEVLDKGKPFFGICLGLQVLAEVGFEEGERAGLGWFRGRVERLTPRGPGLRVPHIGWNDLELRSQSHLFRRLRAAPVVYFDHSYSFVSSDESVIAATCDHGGSLVAAIQRDNIFATQFHPEKSQQVGLRVLENFLTWVP